MSDKKEVPDVEIPNQGITVKGPEEVSEFEKGLFSEGTYRANLDEVVGFGEELVDSMTERMIVHATKHKIGVRVSQVPLIKGQAIDVATPLVHYASAWVQAWEGKIPARWEDGDKMMSDLLEAGRRGTHLSDALINAAISAPNDYILKAAAQIQRLSLKQLGWILYSPWMKKFYEHKKEEILNDVLDAQKRLGLTEKELEEAKRIAHTLEELEQRGRGAGDILQNALSSPKSGLPNP